MADSLWRRYRETGDAELKDCLIAYNRSDVTILAGVCAHLKAIQAGSVPPVFAPPQFSHDEPISHETPRQPNTQAAHQHGSWRRNVSLGWKARYPRAMSTKRE